MRKDEEAERREKIQWSQPVKTSWATASANRHFPAQSSPFELPMMLPPPTNPPVTLPSVVPAGKGEEEEEVGGAFGGGACQVAGVRYLEKANDFACNCPVCVCVDDDDDDDKVPIEPDPPFEEEFTFCVVVSRFVTAAAAERV